MKYPLRRKRRKPRVTPLLLATSLPAGLGLLALASAPAFGQAADTPAQTAAPKPAAPDPAQTPQAQPPPAQNPMPAGSRIGEIIVIGNKTLSSAYIIAASGHKVGDPCTDQTLSEIQTNLTRTGYFGEHSTDMTSAVRVHSEEYNPPNGQCKVIIEVDENDTIRSVNITGSGPIKPEEVQKLLHINLQSGTVYNEEQFARDFQDIQDLYRRQGYIVIPAQDAGPDPKNPSVLNVDLIVARVTEIKIAGNHKTKTRVILREMRTKVGDYYNENTLNRDVLRLYNMD
ncbi:MAG TPA: POTRA domain-containing protein, partial [Chthonomonadaceae bacterium]|nr:POTRA domain-containing protein [Chthonomonadaceae bacterium]